MFTSGLRNPSCWHAWLVFSTGDCWIDFKVIWWIYLLFPTSQSITLSSTLTRPSYFRPRFRYGSHTVPLGFLFHFTPFSFSASVFAICVVVVVVVVVILVAPAFLDSFLPPPFFIQTSSSAFIFISFFPHGFSTFLFSSHFRAALSEGVWDSDNEISTIWKEMFENKFRIPIRWKKNELLNTKIRIVKRWFTFRSKRIKSEGATEEWQIKHLLFVFLSWFVRGFFSPIFPLIFALSRSSRAGC